MYYNLQLSNTTQTDRRQMRRRGEDVEADELREERDYRYQQEGWTVVGPDGTLQEVPVDRDEDND